MLVKCLLFNFELNDCEYELKLKYIGVSMRIKNIYHSADLWLMFEVWNIFSLCDEIMNFLFTY